MSLLFKKIGLDLGSSVIRVWDQEQGVAAREPACLAKDVHTGEVLAVGAEALEMAGRASRAAQLVFPIRRGVVYDADHLKALLTVLLKPYWKPRYLLQPTIAVSLPAAATKAQQEVTSDLIYSLGAKEVITVASPLAAGIGTGVPIADASGSFFLHTGAGMVEAVVISLGSLAAEESSSFAGEYLDRQLRQAIIEHFQLKVGFGQLALIKRDLISLDPDLDRVLTVAGKDTQTQEPKSVELSSAMLRPKVSRVFNRYSLLLTRLLKKIPPDLTTDSLDKGLLITGGLAQTNGIARYLASQLKLPAAVADKPEDAVIDGLGVVLLHLDEFKNSLGYQRS